MATHGQEITDTCANRASPFERTGINKIYHFKLSMSNVVEVKNVGTNYAQLTILASEKE